MKNIYYILLLVLSFGWTSCEIEEQTDPNNPSLQGIENNASEAELNALVYGSLAGMRTGYYNYVTSTGTVARELYLFDADPRNTSDLLGKDGLQLDNNSFYLTAPYIGRYRVVKNTNILLEAIDNTETVSDAEKNGYEAFAKTIKAHQLLLNLNMLGSNGVRLDVSDPDNLGEFVGYDQSLEAIQTMLNEAAAILQSNNVEFNFSLPGFNSFEDPEGFYEFNRALAARVAAYQENWQAVLDNLEDSFFSLQGELETGPEMTFSTASGDVFNPLYKNPENSDDQIYAHPDFVAEAEENDQRIESKIIERASPTTKDNLTSRYSTGLYETSTAPISIIRNEELILLYAEAKIQLGGAANLSDAITALNIIRNEYGLEDYEGPETQEALIDEMLEQRRYSFWAEGHRMVDLRRYDRLNADYLPIDRSGDQVFQQFPIPITEN